jgi:pyruvate kinase
MYSVKVLTGQELRVSTNKTLEGEDGMIVLDYENLEEKLAIGDKILIDYGGIVLTVIGYDTEERYMKAKKRAAKKKQSSNFFNMQNPDSEIKEP